MWPLLQQMTGKEKFVCGHARRKNVEFKVRVEGLRRFDGRTCDLWSIAIYFVVLLESLKCSDYRCVVCVFCSNILFLDLLVRKNAPHPDTARFDL